MLEKSKSWVYTPLTMNDFERYRDKIRRIPDLISKQRDAILARDLKEAQEILAREQRLAQIEKARNDRFSEIIEGSALTEVFERERGEFFEGKGKVSRKYEYNPGSKSTGDYRLESSSGSPSSHTVTITYDTKRWSKNVVIQFEVKVGGWAEDRWVAIILGKYYPGHNRQERDQRFSHIKNDSGWDIGHTVLDLSKDLRPQTETSISRLVYKGVCHQKGIDSRYVNMD